MACRPFTFRPVNQSMVDHINRRSAEYGTRNKYIIALIKSDMGIGTPPVASNLNDIRKIVADEVSRYFTNHPLNTDQEIEIETVVDEVSKGDLNNLITGFENMG